MTYPPSGPFHQAINTIPLMRVAYRIGLFIRNFMVDDKIILAGGLLQKQEEVFDNFVFTDPYHAIMLLFMLSRYEYLEHIDRDRGYLITDKLIEEFPLVDEILDEHEEYTNLLGAIQAKDKTVEILFRSGTWLTKEDFVSIDISDLLIKELDRDVFYDFPELERINLKHNLLGTLPNEIFEPLKELRSLNLANNMISELPLHIFANNTKLEHLNLAYNGIDHRWLQKFTVLNRLIHQNLEIKI